MVLLRVQPQPEHCQAVVPHQQQQLWPVPFFPAEPPAVLGCVLWAPHWEEGRRGCQPSLVPCEVLWLLRVNSLLFLLHC